MTDAMLNINRLRNEPGMVNCFAGGIENRLR